MRPAVKILLPTLAVSLALAACGSSHSSSSSPATSAPSTSASSTSGASGAPAEAVKTAYNAKLGASVLVSARGMTIYHLSGEGAGRFLCASAECEARWPPVSASATSARVAGLGTVVRPDGKRQLTYEGEPLYTFAGDSAPGEANGQGIDDVGTWSAVQAGGSAGSDSSSSGGSTGSGAASSGGSSSSSSSGEASGYKY